VWESNPPLRLERAVSCADRRTSQRPGVGRGTLESPSARLQSAAGPSQRPMHSVLHRKGLVSSPQGIERERARRRIGGWLRFLATQCITRTPGKHGRPQCKGCLRPTRLAALPSSCTFRDASPQKDVRAISRRCKEAASGTPGPRDVGLIHWRANHGLLDLQDTQLSDAPFDSERRNVFEA
jgi:hypothetical protein